MAISASDFVTSRWLPDPWTPGRVIESGEELDRPRLEGLIVRQEPGHSDVEVALALMDLVRDDFARSGTGGGETLSDADMRLAVRALERVATRAGQEFKMPFRDHSAWREWWPRHGAYGSWQARRDLLGGIFDQPYAALMAVQDRHLDAVLAEAVSPRDRLDWPEVDTEVGELRRHFRTATTPQDYRAVGNDCVHLIEALSRKVYDHARHGLPEDDGEPSVDKTKLRLTRYITARLSGPDNAEMRRFARSAIELAQAVKHSGVPTRTEAGVLADAVILLANMLRRLDED